MINAWSAKLGIEPPKTCRIKRSQVLNEYNRPYRFCGYCAAEDTIYYHGKLDEPTLVHELCHKKWPNIAEKDIRTITKVLLEVK